MASRTLSTAERRWATLPAAADYADTSTRTLERYHVQGLITIHKTPTGMRRVDLNEIDQLLRPLPNGHVGEPAALAAANGRA